MIVPSIDLMNGSAVQLVGGREKALDAGDPHPLARRFGRVGEIAVIDLDAALRQGTNEDTIRLMLSAADCRVGGGIRTVESAIDWLDRGAAKVILGTAAELETLRQLPRERVIAALDSVNGEVVVDGWRTRSGRNVIDRIRELRNEVSGFLVTFVEREGRMAGTDLDAIARLRAEVGDSKLTVAGGITTPQEIAALDSMGVDAQVGMALYTGRMSLGSGFAAPLKSDRPDGLWPTVVCDERGVALGLSFSNGQSLSEALDSGRGVYHSRRRGLWVKGSTSGATQELLRVDMDCDRDAIRFVVRQNDPGFCHLGTHSCWGAARGFQRLESTLGARANLTTPGSYTARLLNDATLLASKLWEEVTEFNEAPERDALTAEAADVLYFVMVRLTRDGVSLADVEAELDRRSRRITRRPGNAKPPFKEASL